jgi:hypothetical protein
MTLTVTLTEHSRNRLLGTFALHGVSKEYADPLYNYLVHGFHPGSFWTAVLANDFMAAIANSHPANTVPALKKVGTWLNDCLPRGTAWGSYEAFKQWLALSSQERRATLENLRLIHTGPDEIILLLKETPTAEPILW